MEKSLLDAGYRKYTGSDIDVFFSTGICIHSGALRYIIKEDAK